MLCYVLMLHHRKGYKEICKKPSIRFRDMLTFALITARAWAIHSFNYLLGYLTLLIRARADLAVSKTKIHIL